MQPWLDNTWLLILRLSCRLGGLGKLPSAAWLSNQVICKWIKHWEEQNHLKKNKTACCPFTRLKGCFYPLFWWLIAPHVCNLAEVFYGHLIIFLKSFQTIKVSDQMEELWSSKQTHFQNWAELKQFWALDFNSWFEVANDLQMTCNWSYWKEHILNLNLGLLHPNHTHWKVT